MVRIYIIDSGIKIPELQIENLRKNTILFGAGQAEIKEHFYKMVVLFYGKAYRLAT